MSGGDAGYRGIEKREGHEDRKVAWHSDEVGTTQKMSWRPVGTSDGTVEVGCEDKSGRRVVPCQADVWLREDLLPRPGKERESAGPTTWVRQFSEGGGLYGLMLGG